MPTYVFDTVRCPIEPIEPIPSTPILVDPRVPAPPKRMPGDRIATTERLPLEDCVALVAGSPTSVGFAENSAATGSAAIAVNPDSAGCGYTIVPELIVPCPPLSSLATSGRPVKYGPGAGAEVAGCVGAIRLVVNNSDYCNRTLDVELIMPQTEFTVGHSIEVNTTANCLAQPQGNVTITPLADGCKLHLDFDFEFLLPEPCPPSPDYFFWLFGAYQSFYGYGSCVYNIYNTYNIYNHYGIYYNSGPTFDQSVWNSVDFLNFFDERFWFWFNQTCAYQCYYWYNYIPYTPYTPYVPPEPEPLPMSAARVLTSHRIVEVDDEGITVEESGVVTIDGRVSFGEPQRRRIERRRRTSTAAEIDATSYDGDDILELLHAGVDAFDPASLFAEAVGRERTYSVVPLESDRVRSDIAGKLKNWGPIRRRQQFAAILDPREGRWTQRNDRDADYSIFAGGNLQGSAILASAQTLKTLATHWNRVVGEPWDRIRRILLGAGIAVISPSDVLVDATKPEPFGTVGYCGPECSDWLREIVRGRKVEIRDAFGEGATIVVSQEAAAYRNSTARNAETLAEAVSRFDGRPETSDFEPDTLVCYGETPSRPPKSVEIAVLLACDAENLDGFVRDPVSPLNATLWRRSQ